MARQKITKKEKNEYMKNLEKSRKERRKIGFYYSFLTIALIFCLIEVGYSAILNISKLVAYKAKTVTLKKTLSDAENYNKDLKDNIKLYSSSTQNLEGIARNTLKMAGEDEVLVIINTQPAPEKKKKHKKKAEKKQDAE